MNFYPGFSSGFDKEIAKLKALQKLDNLIFITRDLHLMPGQILSPGERLAASVLQFAPYSNAYNYLSKSTVEHVLGQYVSEKEVWAAAKALGIPMREDLMATSRAFIRRLEAVQELGCVLVFPEPGQKKTR